jgi:predicted alpha/beta hydrolase family esterase
MPNTISVLCVHGIGHGDIDPNLQQTWTDTITAGLATWDHDITVTCDFLKYDDLFEQEPLNSVTYATAFAKLLASGVVHGIGDLFTRERGLFELPDKIRWTAGMVAQWISEEQLREKARALILKKLQADDYGVVCAHSLGSLLCYDTFLRNPKAVKGKYFVSFGSQIGNPCVRDAFAGRIAPLQQAARWFHLYNPDDHVFTADIHMDAANFEEVGTEFDAPNDILNHEATWYLDHQQTRSTVWRELSGVTIPKPLARGLKIFHKQNAKPQRRALLVGINDYPDPANRLDGCVNDVYLISAILQESGFAPEDIRIVLNERATAAGINDRLHWLLDDVNGGDQRLFFYSGHGAQMPVYGATDEVDQMNECLVPYDFDWTPQHAFTDKQFVNFYSQLPYDCYFAAIFDCCHSGGMTREGGRKIRGIAPPDDIRHRSLRWNADLQMWEDRPLVQMNPSLAGSKAGRDYLGTSGATFRMGRAMNLRTLPNNQYDKVRRDLKHHGPYLPVIMEACQEAQLSYEYRHGAQSYGAFTFSLAEALRADRRRGKNPTFLQLQNSIADRLKKLKYDQTPNLVGAGKILRQQVPWMRKGKTAKE